MGQAETYNGKLTENIVQATARDLLAHAMGYVAAAGHTIVMHVHDEIIVETTTATVYEICALVTVASAWAEGLPLEADGYKCSSYMKD